MKCAKLENSNNDGGGGGVIDKMWEKWHSLVYNKTAAQWVKKRIETSERGQTAEKM